MKSFAKRFLAFVLTLMLCTSAMLVPASAADSVPVTDTSFYQLASIASTFLSDALATNSSAILGASGSGAATVLRNTTVGGLLGYSDSADESGIISGWIASALSYSSATYSYAGLYDLKGNVDSGATYNTGSRMFWEYAQYGYLLNQVGFDGTGSESSQLQRGARAVSGFLMDIAFKAVSTVSGLFRGIVDILDLLNPFKLFKPPEDKLASLNIEYADQSGATGAWADLGRTMGSIYSFIWSNAGLIIGVWLVIFVITVMLSLGGNFGGAWPQFKRFLLRVFCLVLGIPLLAVTYTEVLGMLRDENLFASPVDAAGQSVMEIYVDFENWSMRGRLGLNDVDDAVFGGRVVSTSAGVPTVVMPTFDTYRYLSQTCLGINMKYSGISTSSSDDEYISEIADSMLSRYSSSATFTASDFENYWKTFLTYNSMKDLLEKSGTTVSAFKDNFSDLFSASSIPRLNIWSNGSSTGLVASPLATYSKNSELDYSDAGYISAMSMYNYLSTRFDSTNMTVYSNEKASSGFVRDVHYSVNLIGSGFASFMYWLSTWVELIMIALLGWVWGIGLFINTISVRFVSVWRFRALC